ncbi:hypothetical protein HYPGJ_31530 [Hyphomicrobium sp. GJ21]|nr:hypothetical protein HYPGJ_31530 [Hyphomicrobium sp. GJ21]
MSFKMGRADRIGRTRTELGRANLEGQVKRCGFAHFARAIPRAATNEGARDELSPLVADGIEAMIASIRESSPWKPTVIPGGKQ